MSVVCSNGSVCYIHMKDVFCVLQVESSVNPPARLLLTELTFFCKCKEKKIPSNTSL